MELISRSFDPATIIQLIDYDFGKDLINDGWGRTAPRISVKSAKALPAEDAKDRSKVEYWLAKYTKERYEPFSADKSYPLNVIIPDEFQGEVVDLNKKIANFINRHNALFAMGTIDISDDVTWNKYVATLDKIGVD